MAQHQGPRPVPGSFLRTTVIRDLAQGDESVYTAAAVISPGNIHTTVVALCKTIVQGLQDGRVSPNEERHASMAFTHLEEAWLLMHRMGVDHVPTNQDCVMVQVPGSDTAV